MLVPNYIHHSKKELKRTLKPQALRQAKKRTKTLIKHLISQSNTSRTHEVSCNTTIRSGFYT